MASVVVARNLATDSDNRIHADDVARKYGFRGGLVPGITTFAYMTKPVVDGLGAEWLERGSMAARFLAPVYDGEQVRASARLQERSNSCLRLDLTVVNAAGEVCATGCAELAATGPEPPDPSQYPESPLPEPRPDATVSALATLDVLGTVRRTFRAHRAGEFLDAIDDPTPLYRGGPAHPGWLIYDANQALARNVRLGPWIHVASETTHFSLVSDGEQVATRGRVAGVYERNGHHFVELDLLMVAATPGSASASEARPVWRVRHTAIFRIRQPHAGS